MSAANSLMSQAQKECPASGMLWAERILNLEDRTKRKQRALEAIKKLQNDKFLILTIARLFWAERKLEKAVNWFEKALAADPDYGDTWAWYYKFLLQYGTDEKKDDIISQCTSADPKDGEVWTHVARDPRNFGKSVEEVLKMVVKELQ
jgi:pre-mRNA-processing factor 6